jgi:hypothetical protein
MQFAPLSFSLTSMSSCEIIDILVECDMDANGAVMRRITTFRSTTDRIYDSGPLTPLRYHEKSYVNRIMGSIYHGVNMTLFKKIK